MFASDQSDVKDHCPTKDWTSQMRLHSISSLILNVHLPSLSNIPPTEQLEHHKNGATVKRRRTLLVLLGPISMKELFNILLLAPEYPVFGVKFASV